MMISISLSNLVFQHSYVLWLTCSDLPVCPFLCVLQQATFVTKEYTTIKTFLKTSIMLSKEQLLEHAVFTAHSVL